MSSPKYLTPLLEKLGIPNSKAAKASRKAAEGAVMPPLPSRVNNNTRKKKIQQIKNAVARQIARANFLQAIENEAEKRKRAEEIYNEWMRRAELKLRSQPNAPLSVRSSKNLSKSKTPNSKSKSPRKTRRNRS
jgi:hypothetical protein